MPETQRNRSDVSDFNYYNDNNIVLHKVYSKINFKFYFSDNRWEITSNLMSENN